MPSVFPVACHTNNIGKGSTFVAIKGQQEDGGLYILKALEKGASKIVVENNATLSEEIKKHITAMGAELVFVDSARTALAELSAKAADYPAQKLKIIGITGTKGKSTTTHMLYHLLKATGASVACLSTVHNLINDVVFTAPLTTAQPDYLHQFLKLCVKENIEYVVMEVAAQAFTFNRVDNITFDAFIFTNLEREHGELYPTLENYLEAKCELFKHLKSDAPVVVNSDNEYSKIIIKRYQSTYNLLPFTFDQKSDPIVLQAFYNQNNDGIQSITYQKNTFYYTGFSGLFNGYNIVSALLALKECNLSIIDTNNNNPFIFPPLSGRCEQYQLPNKACAIIDYAHTPQSFIAILSNIKQLTPHLIVIFGAGGGKDHEKRPLMGKIASEIADLVIITSDNPRNEDPTIIAQMIQNGVDQKNQYKIIIELDRQKAIESAYKKSQPSSYIMLLGKGPEEYQIIGDKKLFFSEKEILLSL